MRQCRVVEEVELLVIIFFISKKVSSGMVKEYFWQTPRSIKLNELHISYHYHPLGKLNLLGISNCDAAKSAPLLY